MATEKGVAPQGRRRGLHLEHVDTQRRVVSAVCSSSKAVDEYHGDSLGSITRSPGGPHPFRAAALSTGFHPRQIIFRVSVVYFGACCVCDGRK